MWYLIFEILLCLMAAGLMGLLLGWLPSLVGTLRIGELESTVRGLEQRLAAFEDAVTKPALAPEGERTRAVTTPTSLPVKINSRIIQVGVEAS